MQSNTPKSRIIQIRYQGKTQRFELPPRRKIEEFKYMLEDFFGFETFARRLIFKYNHTPIEDLESIP